MLKNNMKKITPPPLERLQNGPTVGKGRGVWVEIVRLGYSTESTSVAIYWLAPRQGRVPI